MTGTAQVLRFGVRVDGDLDVAGAVFGRDAGTPLTASMLMVAVDRGGLPGNDRSKKVLAEFRLFVNSRSGKSNSELRMKFLVLRTPRPASEGF
ncbi:hypothetical protein QUA00_21365 [Microcoleus sp. T2B6]